ncbi:hypothetical protein FRC02_004286 [Tulasnella sp. 418]|nr:hypothetical protein FRC02_004286 [Tulasnella sp. 418]
MMKNVLVQSFPPFGTLSLSVPSETSAHQLQEIVIDRLGLASHDFYLCNSSSILPSSAALSALTDDEDTHPIVLNLCARLRGGKGGFGSQLRAAGGRMSSQKTSNNDSCRDLNGRRLSTVKEAKRLAQYLEDEPLRKKAAAEAQKQKLETLEKKLGIYNEKGKGEAGPSTSAKDVNVEQLAGKKHRFDDTEFLEQSQDIVDNVKSAVSLALLKKRKKAKVSNEKEGDSASKDTPAQAPLASAEAPATEQTPAAAPVAVA